MAGLGLGLGLVFVRDRMDPRIRYPEQVTSGLRLTILGAVPDMGRHYYPYLPVSLLARIRYPTEAYLREVRAPVLVIHSREDEIVLVEWPERAGSWVPPGTHRFRFFHVPDPGVRGVEAG